MPTGPSDQEGPLGNDSIDAQDGAGRDTANGGFGTDTCTGDTLASC
ncbi:MULTISPECIES: hypothetical protein [Streptomyces]|nr:MULTISPECIES: hypothetical protein [unclassified Streptomyces]RPK70206.1 hypothetical protein EES45_35875 [Streptomyces sp. ADI97-07]